MSAALAEAPMQEMAPVADTPVSEEGSLSQEIRLGFEELRGMSHTELRGVIDARVQMLEGVLREREERRAAIETAQMASKMLEIRRDRSIQIRRQVDYGSTLAAVASTILIVAVMV